LTRSLPQLGDLALSTKPTRLAPASASARRAASASMRSVQSAPLSAPRMSVRPRAPRTSRTASRGTPMPTSTSGHTGTQVTNGASSSFKNASRLCWPS
jgi:hypothetical protein